MERRKQRILDFMREEAYRPMLFQELAAVLCVPKEDLDLFRKVLEELEEEGKIFKTHRNRYLAPEKMNLIAGRFQGHELGYGFVLPDGGASPDVFIPADGLNGAMHNDRVLARIMKRGAGKKSPEGEVVKVLKRANRTVVGTFEKNRNFGFVVPDDRRISGDIFIPGDEFNGARQGQKVVAEILQWPGKRRNAEGRIAEILGDKDQPGVDVLSILKAYDLNEEFPGDVLKQAAAIPDEVGPELLKGRADLRDIRTITIDNEDARDLDDAVSIERLPGGGYRLGVHIADVSYYVPEGSPLDREALKRGTSVYLVDRVIPMLPPKLSNGICSLNPGADRLAFSVIMDIDPAGRVQGYQMLESVIRVARRMTYANVFKLLTGEDPELAEKYAFLLEDLKDMERLALTLRQRRMERGALDFEIDETRVVLDERGKPVEVKRNEITIANRIIEEFMLICNETVAQHFYWAETPFVYRIHEDPDEEKILAFAKFVRSMGYSVKGMGKIHPKALQQLLEKTRGTREGRIISTVMLRSLQKAKYSHENKSHFGLAAKFYCHFTAPIRRYPDLIIHRIMKEQLKGAMTPEREEKLKKRLPAVAQRCTEREIAAEEAERDTVELKVVEYMKDRVGEFFEAIVSNVTPFGLFVQLDNTAEGLVRAASLEDDYYVYNEDRYCLVGERTRKTYRIGDLVTVQLERADLETRQIEFIIIDKRQKDQEKEEGGKKGGKKAKGGKTRARATGKGKGRGRK